MQCKYIRERPLACMSEGLKIRNNHIFLPRTCKPTLHHLPFRRSANSSHSAPAPDHPSYSMQPGLEVQKGILPMQLHQEYMSGDICYSHQFHKLEILFNSGVHLYISPMLPQIQPQDI